jgi:hypothetical protein
VPLYFPTGVTVARRTLNPQAAGRHRRWEPFFQTGGSYKSIITGFDPEEEGALPSPPATFRPAGETDIISRFERDVEGAIPSRGTLHWLVRLTAGRPPD